MMPLRAILLISCCLLGAAMADNPSSGYAAPSGGGGGSGYAAPASGYSSPAAGYEQPTGYAAPSYDAQSYDYSTSYDAPATYQADDNGGGLDLSKLAVLIPLFLAVLAAIIIAALIGPFIAQLGAVLVGILPMALDIKAPIINAILAPFNLTLCSPGTPPTVFPSGRQFADMATEYLGVSDEQYDVASNMLYSFLENLREQSS